MPIEYKVSRELGGDKARTMPKLELRKLCRAEAEKWVDLQRSDFRRLGCIGDWFNPYLTMANEYEAAEIGVLRKLVEIRLRLSRPAAGALVLRLPHRRWPRLKSSTKSTLSPSIYVAFAFNANLERCGELAAISQ